MEVGELPNTTWGDFFVEAMKFGASVAFGYVASQGFNRWYVPVGVYFVVLAFEKYGDLYEKRRHETEIERIRKDRIKSQLNLLLKLHPFESNANVRATYHVPVENDEGETELRQWIDYVPPGVENQAGRVFPASKGIIGRSYAEKESFTENFHSNAEFQKKMRTEYEFSEGEIRKRSADRRSYFCKPVIPSHTNEVVGLIYFDATEPGTFPDDWEEDEYDEIMRPLLMMCENIRESV